MIDEVTRAAFADELAKIAGLKTEVGNVISAGWHGTPQNPQKWMGEGLKITPKMGRLGKAMEYASSLGGATKYLPVGGKSMALLGTAAMAPMALAKEDPTGHGKSRFERTTGLVGNTLGGLAASGAMIRHGIKNPFALAAGGLLGSVGGERLITSPFALIRRGFRRHPPAVLPQQSNDGGWQNTAPGGLNTTPDAVVGQAQAM